MIKSIFLVSMLSLIILLSGCVTQQDQNGGEGATSARLTMYATAENSDSNRILVSPGDEFIIDIGTMNLADEDMFSVKLSYPDGIEPVDNPEFNTTIPFSREKIFLRSIKFQAQQNGYYKILVVAEAKQNGEITGYGATSFWVCAVSNPDDKKDVCGWDDTQGNDTQGQYIGP